MEPEICAPEQAEITTISSGEGLHRENSHDDNIEQELLSKRLCDETSSIEHVSIQLKDKLGIRGGCEKNVYRPNGCWLGVNLNRENGFTKLENHTLWSADRREQQNQVNSQSSSFSSQAAENEIHSKSVSLKIEQPVSSSDFTSPETEKDHVEESSVKETGCECIHDSNCAEEASKSDVVLGPFKYSYVSIEKPSPVVAVKTKPEGVLVADSVIAPQPFQPMPNATSLSTCTYSSDDSVDGIRYVAYESELQMPDIMRLIQKDLSEPYSIYTYRYFIHNWPKLCFLAMHGEKCVGAIVCKLDLHKKVVHRGYIAMLAVDEHYRKRKIGSSLVLKAIQAMVTDDADEVVLETEISNKPALRLYENLGFVRDKRLFRYYLNGVDALRLKLWLR